ncbi:hypothetical protein BC936DRAFT_141198 [Jimgerdemannia flammicorona]|uniref:Uncharacterized protein n=1 Tax=Jimgerdemannia flammicorona TaxID=994334 RepID=A0A433A2Q5_9FUNG|nr:hypothetical protein BC936DRAFT_141198 [Jimgerdemannia flammicorona]
MGRIYESQGKHDKAEPLHEVTLAIRENMLGSGAPIHGIIFGQAGWATKGREIRQGRAAVRAGAGDSCKGVGIEAPRHGNISEQS